MSPPDLLTRLQALPSLDWIPPEEMEWLAAHGTYEEQRAGSAVAQKGEHVDKLWILLAGRVAIRVDRGAGPRLVLEWRQGDVAGLLPYSRMGGVPGDTMVEEDSESITVHQGHFREMISACPVFTAHTVHLMLDRARSFNTSELQDEKMVSLGRLAAGLAHELNNPASATVRAAKLLTDGLAEADAAARALGAAGLTGPQLETIERVRAACIAKPTGAPLGPLEQADREDEIADWLEKNDADVALASPLADTAVDLDTLDVLAEGLSGDALGVALRWIGAGCTTYVLATDIERAATRIYELVDATKRFTFMDNLAAPEAVDVEAGVRDTLRVLSSKVKAKGATVTLDIEGDLPKARATGGELNQVWMNLLDNALDAIGESGHIDVTARSELNRVFVSVVDDGPGVPDDVLPRIFDPFFTTKEPGQGTGLGLDITRRLLRRYKGDVTVESRPGRTAFTVTLERA